MEENKIITFMTEEGEKVDFEIVETIHLEENKYVIIAPVGEEEDGYVYKVVEVDGKAEYIAVEEEEEFEKVLEVYEASFEE